MKIRDIALSRRSTRRYKTGAAIPKEHLDLCADTARYTPSACNSQPWKFIVVNAPGTLAEISKHVLSGIYKMNSFASNASAFIAIVTEKTKITAGVGGRIMGTDFRQTDTGMACAHVVLQAEELGIKTCILGWFNERKLKKILSVPRGKKIKLLIAMGYLQDNAVIPERKLKPSEETISFNKYR